ncbi:MAG: integrase core domain-containing protein, partial [Syntrophobacterales bacterium]|nr:integrase core domain-containing protein [Syntrophobacterales bacterium]
MNPWAIVAGHPFVPRTKRLGRRKKRFNGSLLRELLKYQEIADFEHTQREFDEYRSFYNYERPHHALCLGFPFQRYSKSCRKLPRSIDEWEYVQGFL